MAGLTSSTSTFRAGVFAAINNKADEAARISDLGKQFGDFGEPYRLAEIMDEPGI
ncbi:MAG: hypothetical protein R3D29_15335 [Nitratireductor sp.]